jgi:inorganic phosphate transporter, PiT family
VVDVIEQMIGIAVVVGFALVNGINDGGTIMSLGLRSAVAWPWLRLVALVGVLAAAPMLLGAKVAATLVERLVDFEGDVGQTAMLSAVIGTLAIVWLLTSRGWPTSLTLGLVGALAGAGLAAGLPVGWGTIGLVLLIAAVAPAVGVLGAMALHRVVRPILTIAPGMRRHLPTAGHLLQCLAYGTNDGQKMLAVLVLVAGTTTVVTEVPLALWVAVVLVFAGGTVLGIARVGPTIDGKILPVRTQQVSLAQLSGAGAVLASAVVASPVSLTQGLSGGLVGAGVSVTPGRIRWAAVGQIGFAWAVTLPAAFVAGGLLTATVAAVRS